MSNNDIKKIHKEMLFPAVRIRKNNGSNGSGVIVSSKKNKKGTINTFILTNYHVIEDTIKIVEKWDVTEKEKVDVEVHDGCCVEVFNYDKKMEISSVSSYFSEVVSFGSWKAGTDYALLHIKSCDRILKPAIINEEKFVSIGEEVWTVGAPEDVFPTITKGIIGNKSTRFDGCDMMLITAPIFYGSSGGPVYKFSEEKDSYTLIGIVSKVLIDEITDKKAETNVKQMISHMAFAIPFEKIYEWLDDDGFDFIFK